MKQSERDEVYLDVIKELVREKEKWEDRYKHPLPSGWCYADEHPMIGEVIALFSDILKDKKI